MINQKGLAPILIIVLIVLGIGGYFIYQNQTKSIPQTQPTIQPSPTPQETPASNIQSSPSSASVSKPNTKSGWKSYNHSKIGFSYQLPDDGTWLVRNTNVKGGVNNGLSLERNSKDQFIEIAIYDNPKGLGRREFYCSNIVYNNPDEETLQDCLKTGISVKDTKVGNREAIYITQPGTQVDHARVLNHKGKIVIITDHAVSFPQTPLPEGFDWNKLRDEILATFWFN